MPQVRLNYIIGLVIVIGAIVYLMMTTSRAALRYYVTVKELKQNFSHYVASELKVAGIVSENSIQQETDLSHTFVIQEEGETLRVHYAGFLPDTFKTGAEVVVTGQWQGDHLQASHVLAKCGSRYEARVQP